MSTFHRNTDKSGTIPVAEVEIDEGDARRSGILARIRNAILKENFRETSDREKSGADPYNSGVHRSLEKKPHSWDKRSR